MDKLSIIEFQSSIYKNGDSAHFIEHILALNENLYIYIYIKPVHVYTSFIFPIVFLSPIPMRFWYSPLEQEQWHSVTQLKRWPQGTVKGCQRLSTRIAGLWVTLSLTHTEPTELRNWNKICSPNPTCPVQTLTAPHQLLNWFYGIMQVTTSHYNFTPT